MGVGVPHSMQVGRLHGSAIFISVFEFYSRRTDVEKKEEARGWGGAFRDIIKPKDQQWVHWVSGLSDSE